jgi:hypothetical protein
MNMITSSFEGHRVYYCMLDPSMGWNLLESNAQMALPRGSGMLLQVSFETCFFLYFSSHLIIIITALLSSLIQPSTCVGRIAEKKV